MAFKIGIFGTTTNYTEFESDGSLSMAGSATIFDDESASTLGLLQTGPGVSNNLTEGTTEFTTTSNLSDYIITSVQMKHAAKIGAVIYPHIHFFQTTAGAPNFLFQYRWQSQGEAQTSSWTNLICNTLVFTYVSGTLNQIARTASGITPPGNAGLSDIVQFRVIRDNANTSTAFAGADPVGVTVGITSFDVHMERDRLGSRDQYTK